MSTQHDTAQFMAATALLSRFNPFMSGQSLPTAQTAPADDARTAQGVTCALVGTNYTDATNQYVYWTTARAAHQGAPPSGVKYAGRATQVAGHVTRRYRVCVPVVSLRDAADTTVNVAETASASSLLLRFEAKVDAWKGVLAPHLYQTILWNFRRILNDEDDLAELGIRPSESSANELFAFLARRPWAKSPTIGMDRRGNFAASWFPGTTPITQAHFTITFRGNGLAHWWYYDNRTAPTINNGGLAPQETLGSVIRAFNREDWIKR